MCQSRINNKMVSSKIVSAVCKQPEVEACIIGSLQSNKQTSK
jgi:hypothetical protein